MLRHATLSLALLALAAPVVSAQNRDVVYYRDHSVKPEKTADFTGTVTEETVNGVKVKPQVGPERAFPVTDIVDIVYAPPTANTIQFQPIVNGESALRTGAGDQKARMTQLVKDYTKFQGELKDPKATALKRHMQFRLAMLRAALAEKREEQLEAINELEKFRKDNAGAWQAIPTVRQEVQMLADIEKLEDAARVLDETAKIPALAKEIKQELELTFIDLMIRAGKAGEVEGRITTALNALPAGDPLAARLKIYQLGCQAGKADADKVVAQLKAIIDKPQDPTLLPLAYNTLGDLYSAKGLKKDAMWSYMWVDVVYNQDKIEHAKAVERLAKVFRDLNDDTRAEKYKEKLKSLR